MYTSDMKGVRITFDNDPFYMRKPDPNDMLELDIFISEGTLSPIPFKQMMSDQYFIMPSFMVKDQFGKDIEYVDDVSGIYNNAVDIQVKQDGQASMSILGAGNLAIHKNKVWSFQEEHRYTLVAFPPPEGGYSSNNFSEISNTAINSIYSGSAPKTEFIDIDICPAKFARLTITLGPLCTYGDELLVKALLEKYSPTSTLKKE